MYKLIKAVDIFHNLVLAYEIPGSNILGDPLTAETEALKSEENTKAFVETHGKELAPNVHYYDFKTKNGTTFVLGEKLVQLNFRAIPQPIIDRSDMRDYNKVIPAIIRWIQQDPTTAEIANDKEAIVRLISVLFGQKRMEGSHYNYCFGNIQVEPNKGPEFEWRGHVFPMTDKQEVGSRKIPYVWLYKAFLTLDDGINYWLNYLKKRNFLEPAKQSADAFVDALRKGAYAGVVKDSAGKIDETATKAKYEQYLKGVASVAKDSKIQDAIALHVNRMISPVNQPQNETSRETRPA